MTFIISLTVLVEGGGALGTWYVLPVHYKGYDRVFCAVFHAISSFCNAGITVLPEGMLAYRSNIPFLVITVLMVIIGGFGFMSLHELLNYAKALYSRKRPRLSLHTKVNITTTFFMTLIAGIILWFLEYQHTFSHAPLLTTFTNIFFDASCARSAGFTTLNMMLAQLPTLFLIMLVSFIGASPGSTGSGIKTTTFALFLATARAVILGRTVVELKGRRVPNDQVFKAMAVLSLSLTWISLALFLLLISEKGWSFIDIMFETFSAFTNLGLSTGITSHLTISGKMLIILMMIVGRIGSLTLIIALKRRHEHVEFRYPEERLLLS